MNAHAVFWLFGCGLGFGAALWVLHRRGALSPGTHLALWFAFLGFALGSKWHFRLERMPVAEALWMSPSDWLDGGGRLPLGLLCGALAAGLWCLFRRENWRAVGDALSVAACALIAAGRLGCLTAGCCMGAVCESGAHFCVRYGTESLTYFSQVADGLLADGSVSSLPAHPLPLYSIGASLLTLLTFVWLLRRRAPAGTLLALFCVVRPISKLWIESFRAHPRDPTLMLGIPLVELGVAALALGVWLMLRRPKARGGFNRLIPGRQPL